MNITLERPALDEADKLQRTIEWRGRTIPVVGPSWRDARLHLAVVIVSVITIGTVWLDWRLSIPQIVVPVVACAVVEAAYRLRTTGALMWPASGMQTATSTVLILRVTGVEHGDWWSLDGLHWFVGVAVAGLLTKYVVRTARGHVFNPSNIALVLAFLIAGAERIEPLDFWWGELGWALAGAYAVILVGGFTLCWRLGLLGMAAAFWVTLAGGIGLLAATGHSIATRWSLAPVEGWHLWRTILLSPETLVFLLFMITDPKTIPRGRVGRGAFGVAVGVVATLLIAPWPTEFGAKVGLLAGLAVVSAVRPLLERAVPEPGSAADRLSAVVRRGRRPPVLAAAGAAVAVLAGAIVLAGAPNRGGDADVESDAAAMAEARRLVGERATRLPVITTDRAVAGVSQELATGEGARELVEALYFNLDVEAEAIAGGDPDLLTAVDHGQRLLDMSTAAAAPAPRAVPVYRFETAHLGIAFPGGFQSGPNATVSVTGTVTESLGNTVETRPVELTFTLRKTAGGQWLTTGTLPAATPEP